MTCWQIGGLSAVALILVAQAVGVPCSPLHVSTWWPDLTDFVGARVRAWLR
jgi:hypothetical protein